MLMVNDVGIRRDAAKMRGEMWRKLKQDEHHGLGFKRKGHVLSMF